MEAERRPTDEALLAALRLNDDHIRGLTRLDQQFIYVPLGALAAAVYAAPSLWVGLPRQVLAVALAIALVVVARLVWSGLRRNNGRHDELLAYREQLMKGVDLPAEPPRKEPLWNGLPPVLQALHGGVRYRWGRAASPHQRSLTNKEPTRHF